MAFKINGTEIIDDARELYAEGFSGSGARQLGRRLYDHTNMHGWGTFHDHCSAGNTTTVWHNDNTWQNSSTSYITFHTMDFWCRGTIRLNLTQWQSAGGTTYCRVLRRQGHVDYNTTSTLVTWSTTLTTNVSRSLDFQVYPYTTIEIQLQGDSYSSGGKGGGTTTSVAYMKDIKYKVDEPAQERKPMLIVRNSLGG